MFLDRPQAAGTLRESDRLISSASGSSDWSIKSQCQGRISEANPLQLPYAPIADSPPSTGHKVLTQSRQPYAQLEHSLACEQKTIMKRHR